MENNRLPESIVVKLFDQVKTSSDQNTEAVKDLTRVVSDLTKCIEKQPDLNDMASMCVNRGHDVQDLLKTTTDTNKKTGRVMNRLNVTIITILITFGLMVISYFFVRNSVENMIDIRVEELYNNTEPEDG